MLSIKNFIPSFLHYLLDKHSEEEPAQEKETGESSQERSATPAIAVPLEEPIAAEAAEDQTPTPDTQLELLPGFSMAISRAEVNLLALPFFALWDKDVRKRTETEYNAVITRGEQRLEVSWNVSCNPRYGYPGPFDRKVHRAIEQIISELQPPLENPVPIGSLYRIAKLISLGDSGKTYREIKAALLRIIMTGVESKGTFYHKDRKKWVEDAFHIYDRAVFVGEALPGGEIADTNYLFFGSWYLDNLNARYVKPLDYTYYRSLKGHISSRLYELLGVKFYGLGNHPYIRYRYSTLCQLLPCTRQKYTSQAKQILQPAHQELINSEFLTAVEWEAIPGDKRDWYIKYYPGKRVGEEIQRFRQRPALAAENSDNGVVGESELPPILEDETSQPTLAPAAIQPKRRRRKKSEQPKLTEPQQELLNQMEKLGVSANTAKDLIAGFEFQLICDWLTAVLDKPEEEFTEGRAAYLVSALRDNWKLPDTFRRKQADREKTERQEQERHRRESCTICQGRGVYQIDQNTVAICHHTGERKTTSSTQNLDTEVVWSKVLENLYHQLPARAYETNMKGTTLLGIDDNTAIIQAPNQYTIQQLDRLWGHIAQELSDVLNQEVDVQFISAQQEPPA